jgi:hypothetical protein
MAITTKTYKISHSYYSSAVIKQWLKQWWMVIAFPIIAQILLAVYNGFRTAYLTNPAHSEDFFGLKDDYYKLLLAAREEGLVNVINASKTANGEAVTEEGLEAEFGTVLSSINNIMKNSENKLRQQNKK